MSGFNFGNTGSGTGTGTAFTFGANKYEINRLHTDMRHLNGGYRITS